MTALARLAGLVLPACAEQGAAGLAIPPPERPLRRRPGDAAATRDIPLPAPALARAVAAAAVALPRTFPHAFYDDPAQLHFVMRSRWLNLPFAAVADIAPAGAGSRLALAVRAPCEWAGMGATQRRLLAWQKALDAELHPTTEAEDIPA